MSAKSELYLTTSEVAYILDVSPSTVRDYIYQDMIDGWVKDNSRRILIQFRDLIAMTREYNKAYHAYRACMICSGWHEISKEWSRSVESGTVLLVRVQPRVYEPWYNQADHAEVPQVVNDHFWSRRIHIVPMGDATSEEAEEINKAFKEERGEVPSRSTI